MKIFVYWNTSEAGNVMDITKIVEECYEKTGTQRALIASMVLDMFSGDEIILVDNEEALSKIFPNAHIIELKNTERGDTN